MWAVEFDSPMNRIGEARAEIAHSIVCWTCRSTSLENV